MRIELRGHKAQRRLWRSERRYVAFVGGLGSGKTFAGACKLLLHALMRPESIGDGEELRHPGAKLCPLFWGRFNDGRKFLVVVSQRTAFAPVRHQQQQVAAVLVTGQPLCISEIGPNPKGHPCVGLLIHAPAPLPCSVRQ